MATGGNYGRGLDTGQSLTLGSLQPISAIDLIGENMIKKRWRFPVALAGAARLLATGCSGSASESEGPVTLTYWDFLDPSQDNPRAKALKEKLGDFGGGAPDIKVELAVVSLGDMLNRLPQAAAAGQAPDGFKMVTPQGPRVGAGGGRGA